MTGNDTCDFQQRLAEQTGLSLGLLQRRSITGFVRRRCQELGLQDELAYQRLLIRDPAETELLVNEVSVPETWFFRYPSSYGLLIDHCSALLGQRHDKLRMLSIACATGEEPYGMAMAASQAGWPLDRISVDAIDRHQSSIATARRAVYRRNSFRESVPPWADRWFHHREDAGHVDASIVATVRCWCHDILSGALPTSQTNYDVVFCRNLLIYLGEMARAKLSRLLSSLLSAGGILFVGHAEIPIVAGGSFEPVQIKQSFSLRHRQTATPFPSACSVIPTAPPAQTDDHLDGPQETTPTAKLIFAPEGKSQVPQQPTLDDARAMADAGQLVPALAILENIDSTGPAATDFFSLLGSIKLSLGRLEEAGDAFRRVLYLQPDHEAALLQMAILSDRRGNAQQATRFRRRAMRAHKQSSEQQA